MDAPASGAPAPVTPPVAGNQEGFGAAVAKSAAPEAKPEVKSPVAADKPADAVQAAKDQKEVKAAIEKIKLKSGEYSPEEIDSLIEKSKGADKKFLEASKKEKEARRFFKMAKENPKEFLLKTGMDAEKFKKFAYDEVAEDLKNKLRDPKEVELERAQQRLKEYEAKEAEAKQKAEAARIEREAKALEQRFHAEMIDALESFPQLPKNGFTVAALAKAIDTVREKTGVLLTAKEVAPKVVNDIKQMVAGIVKGSSPEQLIALIGEEGMAAIRKYDIARLKNPMGANGQPVQGETDQEGKPKQKKYKSSHDFWKDI